MLSPLKALLPIDTAVESTQSGLHLTRATNLLLRPQGAISGIPRYDRLFALGSAASMAATITDIDHPTIARKLNAADLTVALLLTAQGRNYIYLYSIPDSALRGWEYLGLSTGATATPSFTTGPVTWTVLATGLDRTARWYFHRTYGQLMAGNGVDDNVCIQLARTATPGIWRKAASNARPTAPVISLVPPASSTNVQAKWDITEWSGGGGKTLTLTAHSENFPGESGNNRIRVTITPTVAAITSALSGSGTPSTDPYNYTVTGGSVTVGTATTGPTATAIRDFITADTKILSIMTAAVSSTGTDGPSTTPRGPTLLSGGTGTGTSIGFSDRTATVIARYWDPGQDGLGYEGISSDASNQLIITADANNDIRVSVAVDPTAESGRFPFIRLYLNFGEDEAEIFSLMDPDNPIPNVAATGSFIVDTVQDYLFKTTSSATVTANASTDLLTGPTLTDGTVIRLTSTSALPGGTNTQTPYYVVQSSSNTFKIALTAGGSAINLTTAGTGTLTAHTLAAHGMVTGSAITLTTSGTLPSPLAISTEYFVTNTETYRFKLLASLESTTAINLTTTGSGTHTFTLTRVVKQLGFPSTPIGPAMAEDQHRPLPHKYTTRAATQTWRAGVTGFTSRLYASKPATADELAPEGCNTEDFVNAESTKSTSGSSVITALDQVQDKLIVHTQTGILIADPAALGSTDPDIAATAWREPPVPVGAINGATLAPLPGGRIYYIASDLSLTAFDASLQFDQIVGTAETSSQPATAYIRARVDTDAIAAKPDRAHLFIDTVGQHIWYFLPALDGSLIGFAYDMLNNGIVGEFTYPKIYATCRMEKTRPEILFADEQGNLFVWDPMTQPDHTDSFAPSTPFTPHLTTDPIPVQYNGYGYTDYAPDGLTTNRYYQSVTTHLETGYIDLGDPVTRKAFLNLLWRTIHASRGYLEITLQTLDGQTTTVRYGDLYEATNHRIEILATDSALKLKLQIVAAEQKPWTLRDLTLDMQPLGPGSV